MYIYLNIPQRLKSFHGKPLAESLWWVGSAEEVGCSTWLLAQALGDELRREIPGEGAIFSKLPSRREVGIPVLMVSNPGWGKARCPLGKRC